MYDKVRSRASMLDGIPEPRRPKRSKTFSGCQTCRSRHLKCDETRPTCIRCAKAKIQCAGYPGYRATVRWASVQGISTYTPAAVRQSSAHHHSSSQLSEEPRNPPPASPVSLTWNIPSSERRPSVSTPQQSVSVPVSDQVDAEISHLESSQPLSDDDDGASPTLGSQQAQQLRRRLPTAIEYHSPSTGSFVAEPSGGDNLCVRGPAPADNSIAQRHVVDSVPDSTSLAGSNILPSDHAKGGHQSIESLSPNRHLEELPTMHLQRKLIEYWVTELSDAMSPIPGSQNPLKTILVPIAFEGAQSSIQDSSSSVALFHLICAAAAEHLSQSIPDPLDTSKSDYSTLSLKHYSQGVWHLQNNLLVDGSPSADVMLACLLICIYYEPSIAAESGGWRTHFHGAVDWVRTADVRQVSFGQSAIILYQMLFATTAMIRSQLLCPDSLSLPNQAFLDQGVSDMPKPYWLDQTIGVSYQVLNGITKTIALVSKEHRQLNCCQQRSSSYKGASSRELDQMELELYLSMPNQSMATLEGENFLSYHYSYIFYFASLIYFKRSLREAPLEDVQSLIGECLCHIEALQQYTERPFSPFVWPVAVTFFEAKGCKLQRRALACLEWYVARSPLSIWTRCKSAVKSLWARRIAEDSELQWDHCFNGDDTVGNIMLV